MNKKIFALLICLTLVTGVLCACNATYKQDAIGGAETTAPVEDNGGLVVKQGKHIYFINGYVGADADNTFGKPFKSSLMRAELDADGAIVADSRVVLVPLNVYSGSANSGIYIYDGYIYFATPNTELDRDGKVNTVYLDFMRTKLDATKTELLFTLNGRNVDFRFNKGRLVISSDGSLYTVDLTAKKTNSDKNYVSIMDRVASAKLIVDDGVFGEYALITRSLDKNTSGKTYNELWAVNADGSKKIKLIGGTTYTDDDNDTNNTYKISVLNYIVEGNDLTVYYTKTLTRGGNAAVTGVYSYTFDGGFSAVDKAKEKHLSYKTASTLTPLGAKDGALVTESASVVRICADENNSPKELGGDEKTVIGKAATVKFVKDGYVYYTASGTATELFRFKLDGTAVEEKVCDFKQLTSWIGADVVGDYVYYIDSENSYTHRYNLAGAHGKEAEIVGKMTAEDEKTYKDAKKTK